MRWQGPQGKCPCSKIALHFTHRDVFALTSSGMLMLRKAPILLRTTTLTLLRSVPFKKCFSMKPGEREKRVFWGRAFLGGAVGSVEASGRQSRPCPSCVGSWKRRHDGDRYTYFWLYLRLLSKLSALPKAALREMEWYDGLNILTLGSDKMGSSCVLPITPFEMLAGCHTTLNSFLICQMRELLSDSWGPSHSVL